MTDGRSLKMLNERQHQPQHQQQQRQQEWSPFVGPRPFKRDAEEQKLFFGRKYESEEDNIPYL